MGGGTSLSTSATRIEALKLQSSAYGVTIPVVGGVNRVPGNLVWYGDFKSVARTSSTPTGGKGGGAKTQSTSYEYYVSVLMGIAQGAIGVSRIWKGKEVYSLGYAPNQYSTATENWTIPATGAMTYALVNGATLAGDVTVLVNDPDGGYPLAAGKQFTVAGGVVTVLDALHRGFTATVRYQYTTGAPSQSALDQLGLTLVNGTLTQTAPAWLVATHADQAPNYRGLAYVHAQGYSLGSSAAVDNHNFEVVGLGAYRYGAAVADCNPADFMANLLANGRYGARMPANRLALTDWSTYCAAAGLLMSPALTEQTRAGDLVDMLCRMTNSAPVWSYNRLEVVPYGDTALTANGVTYSPITAPQYDITDDSWLQDGTDDPLVWEIKQPSDRYNHVKIEFSDRANYYNRTIAEAKDDADIDTNGLRTMATITAPWICEAAVARVVAQLVLQRSLNITGTGRLKLPWAYCLLEPTDLLTLTDAALGFAKLPVRITSIGEDEDGTLDLEVEDYPIGSASATAYPSQVAAGFLHNYNATPGNVQTPVFFEAPVERTLTGLEVYAAVTGTGAGWGGYRVWVSLDGTNYKDMGAKFGGARYGRVTGPVATGVLPVAINSGQLNSGSAADAANLATLCYVGGANPEYLAFTTATLTAAQAYNLSGLTRGAFTTNPSLAAHSANEPFVRVDDAIAKSGPLDLSFIGKTIYFKFCSINIYGGGEQSLASVTPYSYIVTGNMASLPPAQLTSVTATAEPFGLRIACSRSPEPDVVRYEYRQGAAWATAVVLEPSGGTSYLWQVQVAGSYTVWVAPVDALGNYGAPRSASAVLAAGSISGLSSTISGESLILQWAAVTGSFATAGYELRFGASWAAGTVIDFRQTTSYTEAVKWAGSRTYWIASLDVRGNYGTPVSLAVTIGAPGQVTAVRAEVIDNNVLLYWTPPVISSGQLPIDRYEVRKGASFAAGTVVGSNGNSTFTTVFEQASGAYTYWVAAVDTAGTTGAAVAIAASVNQPPDYILRNNYDSTFAVGGIATTSTLVNLYPSGGKLLGPVDTAQTWSTHFSSRGYTSPQDQINAGFPIYATPSTATASYEEILDYGSAIPSTIVTATLGTTLLAGSVTITPTISWRLLATDAWTVMAVGANSALVPTFRYIRIHYDFACTAGANLLQINSLNVKLSIKFRSDSGAGTAAVGGTAVTFGYPFIAADTPIVQPSGATALIPVVIFSGGANPTGFTVRLFNLAGNDVGGAFSWSARGY